MTQADFNKIVSRFKEYYKQDCPKYDATPAHEDKGMWAVVMGRAYPKGADGKKDPGAVYDMFLGAFGLSRTMDVIPWNDNVHLFEGWTNKGDEVFFVNAAMDSSKEAMTYRFSANSCVDGVFGELPFKCQTGWRFEVAFSEFDGVVRGNLKVQYKHKKISLTGDFVSVQRCQLALVDFLKAAREFFEK